MVHEADGQPYGVGAQVNGSEGRHLILSFVLDSNKNKRKRILAGIGRFSPLTPCKMLLNPLKDALSFWNLPFYLPPIIR
jgi:hypothetical protein